MASQTASTQPCSSLKKSESTKDISILSYVSHVQGDLKQMAQEAGADVVLARCADAGGLPSHPAIVSREYGIPGVVGTLDATMLIPDGALVQKRDPTEFVRRWRFHRHVASASEYGLVPA